MTGPLDEKASRSVPEHRSPTRSSGTRIGQASEASRLWTRRQLIAATGVGAITICAAACSPESSDSNRRTVSPSGNIFGEPEALASANGLLEVTLRAEPTDVVWGDATRYAYTYNGTSPGPTLRLRPGDQLVVHLENGLADDTNLHTHGLHVSPSGDGDNIFVRVRPGETRTYVYDIPSDHRSGLFWYHPHAHGTVAKQVAAGLAGAIVIVDGIDDVAEIAGSTERIWVLSDPPIADGPEAFNSSPMDRMVGRQGETILVNGIERPNVTAEAGVIERWRIVNASASRYYRLALDDHRLHTIASDGGRLDAPVSGDEILLVPGERVEFLVTPSAAGTFALRTLRYDRGSVGMGGGMMGQDSLADREVALATLTVIGNDKPADLPSSLLSADELSLPAPVASRVLELGMGMGGAMMGGGMGEMMSFTIDGKTFDADRTDIAVTKGTTEEWEICNTSPMDHPFHLHVWPFLVVDGPSSAGWKDTVNVPAGESVRIHVPFTNIRGRTVYHCHILDHEDLGMMGVIDVSS